MSANGSAVSVTTAFFVRISDSLRRELFRKSIHMMVGMVPTLAMIHFTGTVALLLAGVVLYSWAESQRLSGKEIPLISRTTRLASRDRDNGKAVMGPITLAFGALICLFLFPLPIAAVGIYALAFGDGLSSVSGKLFGKIKLPLTGGKTLEGSLTAFGAILIAAYGASKDWSVALPVALIGMILEMLPLEDLDNMVIPLGTALAFSLLR